MPTSGANPSRPFGEVCIGFPVVNGYPTPPPPPPPPRSSGATDEQPKSCLRDIIAPCLFVAIGFSLFCLIVFASSTEHFPHFQLDSVSVSVDNITAVWDIGFSMDKSVGDLDLWARFMSRDYKVVSRGSAGNWTVSISALLPRGTTGGPTLVLEQVVFKSNNYVDINSPYVLMAACKDVTLSSIQTDQGVIMKGRPRVCPLVYHALK